MEQTLTQQSAQSQSQSDSPVVTPLSSASATRLWRPAAQRNLRNQWSNLASHRQQWESLSSIARSHATSLLNAYLSQRYMSARELGVLSDMRGIRKKACLKLSKQQDLYRSKLLSSYKDMVAVVIHMVTASTSMRVFIKGASNNSLIQFSSCSANRNDNCDGGGIPVFTFWSISSFEMLAQELIQMFTLELILKRLLVTELLTIRSEEIQQVNGLRWSDELYSGEFDDLNKCSLYSKEACEPVLPRLKGKNSDALMLLSNHQPDQDVLQVYLTTWLADVNVDRCRVDEIFSIVGEEIHVALS